MERKPRRPSIPLVIRFWKRVKVDAPDKCWLWTAHRHPQGYGQIASNPPCKQLFAHRVSYEIHFGPIPSGIDCLHHCDNPSCVNPKHLFLGTHSENMADMAKKGRSRNGGKGPPPKLTENNVRLIRELFASGKGTRELGRQFSVTHENIRAIVQRRTWKHLT